MEWYLSAKKKLARSWNGLLLFWTLNDLRRLMVLWNWIVTFGNFNDSFYKTYSRQNMKTTRNKKPRFLKRFWMKNKIFFAWSQTISKISNDHGRWMFRVYKLPIKRIGSILRDKHLILWDFSIRKWETRRHWCLEICFWVIFNFCCGCLL